MLMSVSGAFHVLLLVLAGGKLQTFTALCYRLVGPAQYVFTQPNATTGSLAHSLSINPTETYSRKNQCYKQTNNAEEVLKKGDNIFMKLIFSCTNYQYCAHVPRFPWLIALKGALEVTIRQGKPQLIAFSLSPPHQVGSTVTIITTLSLPSWQSIGSLTSLCSLGRASHNFLALRGALIVIVIYILKVVELKKLSHKSAKCCRTKKLSHKSAKSCRTLC